MRSSRGGGGLRLRPGFAQPCRFQPFVDGREVAIAGLDLLFDVFELVAGRCEVLPDPGGSLPHLLQRLRSLRRIVAVNAELAVASF